MRIAATPNSFFVFDLDDTLCLEVDYVRSAFRQIAETVAPAEALSLFEQMMRRFKAGEEVLGWVLASHGAGHDLPGLLKLYREHQPALALRDGAAAFLHAVTERGIPAGLISDGRSLTQRNKLRALGLADSFCDVIISEEFGSAKPDERNFRYFAERYPGRDFCYFGDNTAKDFIVPARLGWTTVCLRDGGEHIHPQDLTREPRPDHVIGSFAEIELV